MGKAVPEFHDHDALLPRLRAVVDDRAAKLLGVDGCMGAGKSELARRLAADSGVVYVEVDACLQERLYADQRHDHLAGKLYLEHLDLAIQSNRESEAQESGRAVVVKGICLLDVLDRVGRCSGLVVYAKKVSKNSGLWHPEFELEEYEAGARDFSGLELDELAYHSRVRPHERADLVLVCEGDRPSPGHSLL